MDLLKLLSTNEIVAQIISFLALWFLLRKFLWKRILMVLDARREKVESDFRRAEEARKEIARLKAEYEARLAGIEEEANKKIQEALVEGRKLTEEIRKKAYQDAQGIIDNARENIKHELSQAKQNSRKVLSISPSEPRRISFRKN